MLSVFTVAMSWIRSHLPTGERGQDLIEYAMIGGLVAAVLAGVFFVVLSGAVDSFINGVADCIDFVASTPCEA